MKDETPVITLSCPTTEKFRDYFYRLQDGQLVLPLKSPLSPGAVVKLRLSLPGRSEKIIIAGEVSAVSSPTDGRYNTTVDFRKSGQTLMPALRKRLAAFPEYRLLLETESQKNPAHKQPSSTDIPGPAKAFRADAEKGVLTLDWIREAVAQPEMDVAAKQETPVTIGTLTEKTRLTAEERTIAEPAGLFIRNLTRAMLKSGYYDSDHPGCADAKEGLYNEFRQIVRNVPEIMVVNREARGVDDILVSGVLDEPVSLRVLVGEHTADLFVPKLQEYFRRKSLVSFAVKRHISRDHFESFIDIMSDPEAEQPQRGGKVGAYLTTALVEKGITEISAVFLDDMVSLEMNLPWRVEMAIHRLTKDLHVLPMFKGLDSEGFKKMKQSIVQDIIRPLQHPQLLNDLLINCYIIARHVDDMGIEDTEDIIISSFRYELLLPTVEYTFKEYDRLSDARKEKKDSEVLARRLLGIKRILKLIARRVVVEGTGDGQRYIGRLYDKGLLSFSELPSDVQYIIKTRRMADDVRKNCGDYCDGLVKAGNPADIVIYLKCFRRVAASLIGNEDWAVLSSLVKAVDTLSGNTALFTPENVSGVLVSQGGDVISDQAANAVFLDTENITSRALIYIFKESTQLLVTAYRRMITGPDWLTNKRRLLEEIIERLGPLGVEILSRIFQEEENNAVRQAAMELMARLGLLARSWALLQLTDSSDRSWKLYAVAIYVLGRTGQGTDDFALVRKFLGHANINLRLAAVESAAHLKPPDMELLLINALMDDEDKVRRTAVRLIGRVVAPISEQSLNYISGLFIVDPELIPDINDYLSRTERLITGLREMEKIPTKEKVEAAVIEMIESYMNQKPKWKRLLSRRKEWWWPLLAAAIPLLAKIGGTPSVRLLDLLVRSNSPCADQALEAMKTVAAGARG